MDILTQLINQLYGSKEFSELNDRLSKLISPTTFFETNTVIDDVFNQLSKVSKKGILDYLRLSLEKADNLFKDSPNRVLRYYIKAHRYREVITPFGLLRYKRHEYIDRTNNQRFIYVDRKIGLERKQRYHNCVSAMAYSMYSDSNSMIKVGRILGKQIHTFYDSKVDDNTYAISRQSIYRMIKRFKSIDLKIKSKIRTPDTIYIMSDEKYIPSQNNDLKKIMAKVSVIFEGCTPCLSKDNKPLNRNELLNKTYITSIDSNHWDKVNDHIYNLYDYEKIKNIYIMGDGASWIINGTTKCKTQYSSTAFLIDGFHYKQALNRITKDSHIYKILDSYINNNQKDNFINLLSSLKDNSSNIESFESNYNYLLKHWRSYQKLKTLAPFGCPMEQVISHFISSSFTSIPKAYSKTNLKTYLQSRTFRYNGYNLQDIYLKACNIKNNIDGNITLKDDYDFSMFDKTRPPKDNYTLNLPINDFQKNTLF